MQNGISEEEFTQLQNQFLELKTTNYALEDRNRKQEAALSELRSQLQRSSAELARLQQAVDRSKKAREMEALLQANASLEKKLIAQEDDFRLQNQTLLQELSAYVSANEKLEKELQALQEGRPELMEAEFAEETLRLRAECESVRAELASVRQRTSAEVAELRAKVTALAAANSQLERAARGEHAEPAEAEDADYVEVGSGEVAYKKAAGTAHELLEAAEHKIHELQNDIQQYADMRLDLETTRRELELARDELRRLRDASAPGGGGGNEAELRQKLARKQESYLSLQREMESIRESKQLEIDDLKRQLQKDAEEAKARTQRYQTQLNNGYNVLKAEREKSAATIADLTERLRKYEPVASAGEVVSPTREGTAGGSLPGSPARPAADPATAAVRQAEQVERAAADAAESQRQAEARLGETQAQLQQTQASLQQTQASLQEREARLNEAEARLKETEIRLQETEARLQETDARLQEMETRLQESQAALEEAQARLAASEAQLEETETRRAAMEAERDDALKLAQKRRSVLDEMAAHIEQLSAEHADEVRKVGEARDKAQALADSRAEELQKSALSLARLEGDLTRAQESLESERRLRMDLERRVADQEQERAEQERTRLQEAERERQEHRQELERLERSHAETVQDLNTQLEIASAQLAEFKEKVAALRQEVKDSVDEKRIHERKGAAMVKDLRRQLAQERRRAERLQQALQEAPLAAAEKTTSPPPPETDVQSVSSWSLMSGENGAAGSGGGADSPVDTETVNLLARITRLQEEKWRVEEKLNHLEQSCGAMADDLANKAALIQYYCMEGGRTTPAAKGKPAAAASPGGHGPADSLTPVKKKLVDLMKHLSLDEQQRETQRRMQRMLEETLTKNMHLQQDLKTLSDELASLRPKDRA